MYPESILAAEIYIGIHFPKAFYKLKKKNLKHHFCTVKTDCIISGHGAFYRGYTVLSNAEKIMKIGHQKVEKIRF